MKLKIKNKIPIVFLNNELLLVQYSGHVHILNTHPCDPTIYTNKIVYILKLKDSVSFLMPYPALVA